MEINQPTNQPVYAVPAAPGMLNTTLPSTITFAIVVLLFLLPFVDIKCNGMKLQDVKGYELATGFTMKNDDSNQMLNEVEMKDEIKTSTKTKTNQDRKDANIFALAALGIGVVGLILSFVKNNTAAGAGVITGVAGAAALIGLMIDVKQKVKLDMPGGLSDKSKTGTDGFNDLSGIKISVDFTPWFYLAVVAFLLGAFFFYKRRTVTKVNS